MMQEQKEIVKLDTEQCSLSEAFYLENINNFFLFLKSGGAQVPETNIISKSEKEQNSITLPAFG